MGGHRFVRASGRRASIRGLGVSVRACAGLGEAARYAGVVGVDLGRQRAFALAAYARERPESVSGARVLDRGRERCAIVTVAMANRHASGLVAALRERRINTSAAVRQPGMLTFETSAVESALRVSPHYL